MAIATMKTTERKKEHDNDDKDDDKADEDYYNYDQEFKTRRRLGPLPLNHGCDNKYVCDHDYNPVNDPRFRLKATKNHPQPTTKLTTSTTTPVNYVLRLRSQQ